MGCFFSVSTGLGVEPFYYTTFAATHEFSLIESIDPAARIPEDYPAYDKHQNHSTQNN